MEFDVSFFNPLKPSKVSITLPMLSCSGSPLRRITEDQAFALTNALRKKGLDDASVYVGMRYWHPYTEEAVQQVSHSLALVDIEVKVSFILLINLEDSLYYTENSCIESLH
jgi:hypothetical protein